MRPKKCLSSLGRSICARFFTNSGWKKSNGIGSHQALPKGVIDLESSDYLVDILGSGFVSSEPYNADLPDSSLWGPRKYWL